MRRFHVGKRAVAALAFVAAAGSTVGVAKVTQSQQPPPGPAPQVDRVGFPENYQADFQQYYVYDRPDNKQVRIIYANDRAADSTRRPADARERCGDLGGVLGEGQLGVVGAHSWRRGANRWRGCIGRKSHCEG